MKRCNNCGWFNPDSATICEKCEESSFDVDEALVESVAPVPEDVSVPEPVVEPHLKNPMAATVVFAVPEAPVQAASVVDDQASCPKCCYPVSGDVDFCPNCGATIRKPVPVGTQIESSFGMKTVMCSPREELKDTVAEEVKPFSAAQTVPLGVGAVPGVQSGSCDLKATVADVNNFCSVDDEADCSRLVPVDVLGEPDILLRPGEVVVILGKKYRFEK